MTNFPINLSEETGPFPQSFHLPHRQEAVFIHGILMVLVELHQATDSSEGWDKLFQNTSLMHKLQRFGN